MDQTDLGLNRHASPKQAEKACLLDNLIAFCSAIFYILDVGTDLFLSYQYFKAEEWSLFVPTLLLVVVPSIILQCYSLKWHLDDSRQLSCFSKALHIFQCSIIERYWFAFRYGWKTYKKPNEDDYLNYLTNWRDVTFLRFFECFFESAPQTVLQLYILSTKNRRITIVQDWYLLTAVSFSIGSIAWSMVTLTHYTRMCVHSKGIGLCGYVCQVSYRLLMISSRVAALVLFSMAFGWVVIIVVLVHWIAMTLCLAYEGSEFCGSNNKFIEWMLEKLYLVNIGFVYIFCFININKGATRQHVTAYYTVFFVENSLLIALWYPSRKGFGILEIGAICFVWGCFVFGIIFMLLYYKYFHPNQDVTEGWCIPCYNTCCNIESPNDPQNDVEQEESTTQYNETLPTTPSPMNVKRLRTMGIDVEFSPQSRQRKTPRMSKRGSISNGNISQYGTVEIAPNTERENGDEILLAVPSRFNKDHSLKYKVSVEKSYDRSYSFDLSGNFSQIV